jgi:glutathione S-transferase
MKLMFNAASPYARKVRIALLEKGMLDTVDLEAVQPWPEPTAITPFNPLGKIPVMILDDGSALYDSPVICEYVDSLAAAPALIPSGGPARFKTLGLQALADGMLDAAVNTVLERKRTPAAQSSMMLARWTNAIRRSLDVLAADLPMPDRSFDLGQISVACAVGYFDFRLADLDLVTDPRLRKWWDAASRRGSVRSTDPRVS